MKLNPLDILRKSYGEPETVKKVNSVREHKPLAVGDFMLYFKKDVEFDDILNFFKEHNCDISADCSFDHIYIKSNNSDDCIVTEYYVCDEKYNQYLVDYAKDLNEEDPDNEENWQFYYKKMKKFNIYHLIKTHTETESLYVVLLALYISKTNNDVLVYDTYNGAYLDETQLMGIISLE